MRVLVVEDSHRLRDTIVVALKQSGYKVDATGDGNDGLWMAQNHQYDATILDIMVPGMDGLSILKTLRQEENKTPVMFLTAKDSIDDRVAGLRTGAEDYLVKPFALKELLARVEALCRRSYELATPKIKVADLELDTSTKTANRSGTSLDLTAREFALLEHLMLKTSKVVSRMNIEEHIYDDVVSPMSNVVDSAICSLRKKITSPESSKPLIHTRRGHGYILEERNS